MSVYHLPSQATAGAAPDDRPDTTADQTARELVFLAGPGDPWLLPEDNVFDTCAVDVATDGCRRVRLTLAERVTTAYRILTSGGSIRSVCLRLGLPEDTEYKWKQLESWEIRKLPVIVALWFVIASVMQQTS